MTSTLCQSAVLRRIIAPWTATIAVFFHIIVETVLTIAEIVRTTLHETGACCRKAGQWLLALRPELSWPMLPKPETMGRHARLLRHGMGFLPAFGKRAACRYRCGAVEHHRQPQKLMDIEEPEIRDPGGE